MAKPKKRKLMFGRIFDLVLLLIFPLISFLVLFNIFKFSTQYTLKATLFLAIIYFIYLFSCKCKNKFINFIRRILFFLLVVLLFFAYNFSNNIKNMMYSFNSDGHSSKTETIKVDVITLKDSYINKVADLQGLNIGFNKSQDETLNKKSFNKVKSVCNDEIDSTIYDSYNDLLNDLYASHISAAIIPDKNLENTEQLPNLKENVKIIKTYKFKVNSNHKTNDDINVSDEPFTVYLSASDTTGKPTNQSLSDMNMLLMINPKTATINAVSIPRDSFVPNPDLGYQNDKLTHTGSSGVENTIKAVENMFQIKIDFYAKISFDSLIKIVNEIGGIETNVQVKFCEQDENRSFEQKDMVCLNKGEQHLNGKQALAYSRHRHSYENQDLGRNRAQIQVIKGIMKKLLSPSGISKIDDVLAIIPKYVITNMADSQISSMVKQQLDDNADWSFNTYQLDRGSTGSDLTASYPSEELSVYYLSKSDIEIVNGLYNINKNCPNLKDFKFIPKDEYEQYSDWKPKNQYKLSDDPYEYSEMDAGYDENGNYIGE